MTVRATRCDCTRNSCDCTSNSCDCDSNSCGAIAHAQVLEPQDLAGTAFDLTFGKARDQLTCYARCVASSSSPTPKEEEDEEGGEEEDHDEADGNEDARETWSVQSPGTPPPSFFYSPSTRMRRKGSPAAAVAAAVSVAGRSHTRARPPVDAAQGGLEGVCGDEGVCRGEDAGLCSKHGRFSPEPYETYVAEIDIGRGQDTFLDAEVR